MGTLLKVLTVFILLLSIFALVLGIANFNKREQLIGRTHELESSIIALANFIEDRLPGQAGRAGGASDEDDEDEDEDEAAPAPAAAEPAEDVEHVAWDVDRVTSAPASARTSSRRTSPSTGSTSRPSAPPPRGARCTIRARPSAAS